MKVIDWLTRSAEPPISVEIEPPALGQSLADVFALLDPLVDMGIAYVDITYHAEQIVGYVEHHGMRFPVAQRKKPGTAGVAGAIRERYKFQGVEPVPHVICTGFTPYSTEEYLVELAFLGIRNVLALRGDAPKDPRGRPLPFTPAPGGYSHADALIRQIAALKQGRYVGAREGQPLDFCIGAACYPEGHHPGATLEEEVHWAKVKVEAGAEYLVTQMFFDNDVYWRFLERAHQAGLHVPIVPGLKPLTTYRHLEVLPALFGCTLPPELVRQVERFRHSPEDIRKVGIQWCVQQCQALRQGGAPSLHLYAARRAPIRDILKQLL
ncbi:MAG: methylenetetrahydrofolate reductase [Candidatus Tectimicrobiota bacterium]|nr:MAG: methylenetetrahydrofolate reductase [Candidatus Tectomicrobia bacterium]